MQPTLSVSQCIEVITQTLDATLNMIDVEGEVASYNEWNGRLAFFDLKDEGSLISCMIPLNSLDVPVEVGMQVQIVAVPKLTKKGRFNLQARRVMPRGEGALYQAYELLRATLEKEGLFAAERKRELPFFPRRIGIVTSLESAAYRDVLSIIEQRCPGVRIVAVHTQVQGETAPEQIVRAIDYLNTRPDPVDAMIVTRGGGSLEDLLAFNSESVVRAIAASRIPSVVATGHERDSTLAELAADVRAATPTDAAHRIVPERSELQGRVQMCVDRLNQGAVDIMVDQRRLLAGTVNVLARTVQDLPQRQRVVSLTRELQFRKEQVLERHQARICALEEMVAFLDPEAALRRGYGILRHKDGRIVKGIGEASVGDPVVVQLKDGTLGAEVTDKS